MKFASFWECRLHLDWNVTLCKGLFKIYDDFNFSKFLMNFYQFNQNAAITKFTKISKNIMADLQQITQSSFEVIELQVYVPQKTRYLKTYNDAYCSIIFRKQHQI